MFQIRHQYAVKPLALVNTAIRGRIKVFAKDTNTPVPIRQSLNISAHALKEINSQPY